MSIIYSSTVIEKDKILYTSTIYRNTWTCRYSVRKSKNMAAKQNLNVEFYWIRIESQTDLKNSCFRFTDLEYRHTIFQNRERISDILGIKYVNRYHFLQIQSKIHWISKLILYIFLFFPIRFLRKNIELISITFCILLCASYYINLL